MTKRVTLKHIAELLNTSIGTVDRALHDRPGINEETRKRVLKAAEELGYQANRSAQSLSRKRSIRLGCIYPEQPLFYADISAGIERACQGLQDFRVELVSRRTKFLGYKDEIAEMEDLLKMGVDGIAVCPGHRTKMNDVIDKAVSLGIPVVTISSDAP